MQGKLQRSRLLKSTLLKWHPDYMWISMSNECLAFPKNNSLLLSSNHLFAVCREHLSIHMCVFMLPCIVSLMWHYWHLAWQIHLFQTPASPESSKDRLHVEMPLCVCSQPHSGSLLYRLSGLTLMLFFLRLHQYWANSGILFYTVSHFSLSCNLLSFY